MQTFRHPARGFLASVDVPDPTLGVPKPILVEFQYNPTQISDKRTVTYVPMSAPGIVAPRHQYTQGGARTIAFTVRLDSSMSGPVDRSIPLKLDSDGSLTPELNKYRAFLYPPSQRWEEASASFMPLFAGEGRFESPPRVLFGFGFGQEAQPRVVQCIVSEVSIVELMFNDRLGPIRADVSVTLIELAAEDQTTATAPTTTLSRPGEISAGRS